jgi:hypothetical protein
MLSIWSHARIVLDIVSMKLFVWLSGIYLHGRLIRTTASLILTSSSTTAIQISLSTTA